MSLLTGVCIPTNIVMTGKVRALTKVTDSGTMAYLFLLLDHTERPGPISGIKEKVPGAYRAQMTKDILPWAN